MTFTGAPPMSAGSPGIAILFTGPSLTALRLSCMRVLPTSPIGADFGKWWSATKYPSSTLHPQPSAPLLKPVTSGPVSQTSQVSGFWEPSVNLSTPKPGCGTEVKSAARNGPIVDTWWQTETGSIMIAPIPGATPTKPGTATRPFFGVVPEIVNQEGQPVGDNEGGYLTIAKPWPSMLRTVYGDDTRYKETYWSQIPGKYFTGDGARKDENGYFWIMGRVDDVLNVSGHRLSTMEIESALVSHTNVAEAAVVGMPHDLKGEGIYCFVTLEGGSKGDDALQIALTKHVSEQIGAIAKPDKIKFTDALPKTRSGKIMRRLLRDIAAGKESSGDTTTLEDRSVLSKLRD